MSDDPFLGPWQLPVYLPQARQLVSWVHGMGHRYPHLHRIAKVGDYAYFSDKHVVIRWDVHGLKVPDGSWISLDRDQDEANASPDTKTDMADWCKAVRPGSWWDLLDKNRWRKPDGAWYPGAVPKYFTRAGTAWAPTCFDTRQLAGVSLMVRPNKDAPIILAPTVGGNRSCQHCWWVMSNDERVAGLIMPRLIEDGHLNLPKPYEDADGSRLTRDSDVEEMRS